MGALNFIADPYTTRADNAPIRIVKKPVVGTIEIELGVAIVKVHVRHLQGLRQALEFAVAIGNADRTHVVSFGE
jgi:hypothetical protein